MEILNGPIDTLTIGGRVLTDIKNLIWLYGVAVTAGGALYSTARKDNETSGYEVPSGFQLRLVAAFVPAPGATAADLTDFAVYYGDDDVGIASAANLTNPVYPAGDIAAAYVLRCSPPNQGVAVVNRIIPAGKFVGMLINRDTAGIVLGYLEPV